MLAKFLFSSLAIQAAFLTISQTAHADFCSQFSYEDVKALAGHAVICIDPVSGKQALIEKAVLTDGSWKNLFEKANTKVAWKTLDKLSKKELRDYGLTVNATTTISGSGIIDTTGGANGTGTANTGNGKGGNTNGNGNGNGGGNTNGGNGNNGGGNTGGAGNANGGGTDDGGVAGNGNGSGSVTVNGGNGNGSVGGTSTVRPGKGTGNANGGGGASGGVNGSGSGAGGTIIISGGTTPSSGHGSNGGGGNGGGSTTVVIRGGAGGTDYSGGTGKGKKGRGGSSGNASDDQRTQTEVDVQTIANLCPQNGDSRIQMAIDDANKKLDDANDAVKKFTSKDDPNYIDLGSEQHSAALSCRTEYLNFVLDPTGTSACSWKNLGVSDQTTFCQYLAVSDEGDADGGHNTDIQSSGNVHSFIGSFSGNQDACTQAIGKRATPDDQLFALMMKNKGCAAELAKKQDGNELGCQALVDFVADQREYQNALANKKTLTAKADNNKCAVNRATDAKKFNEMDLGTLSVDCLTNVSSTCDVALVNAARVLAALPPAYCAECNQRGGQGGYNTGVSKAAQILGAVGSFAAPLGLGLMNMISYNKGLKACVDTYNTQVAQASVVGLPPQASNCGIQAGLGGYGGVGGMTGVGGYNPFGSAGGGAGGYNPFGGGAGGYGAGGGYNPFGGGAGVGIGGGAYGPYGPYSPYGNTGIGGGLNIGLPSIGFGAGGNPYGNPYGAGGGTGYGVYPYGAVPGIGAGAGINVGLGNPYSGYGSPYGGIGGGVGGGYQGQLNMATAQQQMYDAQTRMQLVNSQNLTAQYGAANGYGLGGQYGNGYPYYAGAGGSGGLYAGGSYNPYGGAYSGSGYGSPYGYGGGIYAGGGSPYGYGSGYGGYGSPYSYAGGGGGSNLLSAGLNVTLPSISAYLNPGSYGAGAGAYAGASGCGYYSSGIPCGAMY